MNNGISCGIGMDKSKIEIGTFIFNGFVTMDLTVNLNKTILYKHNLCTIFTRNIFVLHKDLFGYTYMKIPPYI